MEHLPELRQLISRFADPASRRGWVKGMTAFATDEPTDPLGTVTGPTVALVVQGAKRTVLGDRVFDYHAGQYLVVSVDLPLTAQITQATHDEPFLAFGLVLKPSIIAQLLLEAPGGVGSLRAGHGIVLSDANDDLLDPIVRLLRLVDRPSDLAILGPSIEREIHWRLMTGPQGAAVAEIGLAAGRLSHVGRAIRWISSHYDEVIRIEDLASDVGMSVSSLNRHFRGVTAMSPLQYQKTLRLQQARMQLISAPSDVAAIGFAVGYDSPSQFSREYRRMFGAPPSQDAARLQGLPRTEATRRLQRAEELR